jgi:hypothetical protein
MSTDKIDEGVLRRALEAQRMGKRAAQKAQEENRRLGLPNTYSRNGVNYYELPDGTITSQSPFTKDAEKKQ